MHRINTLYAAVLLTAAVNISGCDNGGSSNYSPPTDEPAAQPDAAPAPMGLVYSQANSPERIRTSSLGTIYTADNDLTLYTFEKDEPGKSNCNGFAEGECADIWPPLYAEANAMPQGQYSVIQRDDGSTQWAYKDYPLYFYKFDNQPGDVNGENVKEVWFVARPDPISTNATELGTVFTGQGTILSVSGNPAERNDFDNFTLYTFAVDQPGVSNCNGLAEGECAEIWPPLYADKAARASGDFTVIDRNDGTQQWAFKEYPLYFFKNDNKPGDTNGENVKGVWFVARPDPISVGETSLGMVYTGTGSIRQGDGDPTVRRNLDGLTLYTFANDAPGESNCNGLAEGECADIWPPLYADKEARATGDFSLITRNDGSMQWALKDLPLYFYKFDEKPGDANGHLVKNVWFVAQPN